ncbi:MAG: molybdopterin molybdotransferase MoeA [Candidatus Bathyarchaeia archaeon]
MKDDDDVRGAGFKEAERLSTALKKWLKACGVKVGSERIKVDEAVNRFSSIEVVSPMDIPPFNRSAVDGYAVKAEDLRDASPLNPISLKVRGAIPVEGPMSVEVNAGEAVEVTTGSPVPEGADAVVMLEQVKRVGDEAQVSSIVKPFENIVLKGEDYSVGEVVLNRGARITPFEVGVLKAMGFEEVNVACKPRVGIGSTGGEVVESVKNAHGFRVVDFNRPTLIALLKEMGAEPIDLGILGDEAGRVSSAVREALNSCDLIILTGGASVGLRDVTVAAVKTLEGHNLIAHGLSVRPGMPTGLWTVRGKPVATLPGHPAAAVVSFLKLVRPMLYHLMDACWEEPFHVQATLTRRVASPTGVRSYVRVRVKRDGGELKAEPVRVHGASMMSSLAKANGILEVPEDVEGYEAGDRVKVTLIKHVTRGRVEDEEDL